MQCSWDGSLPIVALDCSVSLELLAVAWLCSGRLLHPGSVVGFEQLLLHGVGLAPIQGSFGFGLGEHSVPSQF